MSKVEPIAVKVYKPEILTCSKCNSKLAYAYTVSNKTVQFTSGKIFKIKNMGYKCPVCNDHTYISNTAHKMSLKGYTYSMKVSCLIENLKEKHVSRDQICDILILKGLEISDRNIDIIANKVKELLNTDYDSIIKKSYDDMIKEFNEIRISVDFITIESVYYVIIYNYFNGDIIGMWKFNSVDDIKDTLSKYINDNYLITYIISVRPSTGVFPIIKSISPKSAKLLSFSKF